MAWMGGVTAATSAATAAAIQQQAEEEAYMTEEMTQIHGPDWEFKILRSMTNRFDNPQKLRAALEEESQARWELVVKFDGMRVMLRRKISAREADSMLPANVEPYRTQVGGMNMALLIILSVGITVLIAGIVLFIVLVST